MATATPDTDLTIFRVSGNSARVDYQRYGTVIRTIETLPVVFLPDTLSSVASLKIAFDREALLDSLAVKGDADTALYIGMAILYALRPRADSHTDSHTET